MEGARSPPDEPEALAVEGRNCWRRAKADRMAFLVDAAAYFEAFASSAERAQRSILILGWDFDSRVELRHRESAPVAEKPRRLIHRLRLR